MLPIDEIRSFVLREIFLLNFPAILDIFFIILKDSGRSYGKIRSVWIRQKQLDLFDDL